MISRLFLWKKVLNLRGADLVSEMNLFTSAAVDMVAYILGRRSNPISLLGGYYYAHTFGGWALFRIRSMSDDLYFITPGREPSVEEVLRKLARRARSFIDVGANIGYYTVTMALLGLNVLAVEPLPSTARVLEDNVRMNGLKRVKIIRAAAWDREGELTISVRDGLYGEAAVAGENNREVGGRKIRAVRLDDISTDLESPILIKVDAEGSEVHVIKGGKETLERTVALVVEILDENIKTIKDLLKNFKIVHLGGKYYLAINPSFEELLSGS